MNRPIRRHDNESKTGHVPRFAGLFYESVKSLRAWMCDWTESEKERGEGHEELARRWVEMKRAKEDPSPWCIY